MPPTKRTLYDFEFPFMSDGKLKISVPAESEAEAKKILLAELQKITNTI